jgi:RNA polymerase sigma-70 factor, ECF subfamily
VSDQVIASNCRSLDSGAESIRGSLLERVKLHDPDGWQKLVRLYGPAVADWCRRAGLQEADVSDVSQDVFRSVFRSIERFRRDRPTDTFRGWLWSITHRRIQDHRRRLQDRALAQGGSTARLRLGELPAEESHLETSVEQQSTQAGIVARSLELVRTDVEAATWEAFWRVTVEQQTASEVAQSLGTTPGAVYVAKSRVLKRLRELLVGLEDLF